MNTLLVVVSGVTGYLIGSISFARLITRLWSGRDVTQFEIPVHGTEDRYKVLSIGANSVSSELGPLTPTGLRWGMTAFVVILTSE